MKYESSLISALQKCLPTMKFILSDRNGVEPSAPYCLVNIIDIQNVGRPYLTTANKGGIQVEEITQHKHISVSLTLHAVATDSSQDAFERFSIGLGSSFVNNAFVQNGLGIVDYNDIVYQSTPVESSTQGTVMYKRAILDLTLSSERTEEYESPFIKVVEVEGDIIDTDTDLQMTIDFNLG
jgi:hypothetical protein